MKPTQQTPLAILQHKKACISQESLLQEQKLNEHLSYLKENAVSLTFSGLSSLLFSSPSKTPQNENSSQQALTKTNEVKPLLSLVDYLSLGKGLLPVAWEIAQPFVITWGLKSVRKILTNAFFKKKKSHELTIEERRRLKNN